MPSPRRAQRLKMPPTPDVSSIRLTTGGNSSFGNTSAVAKVVGKRDLVDDLVAQAELNSLGGDFDDVNDDVDEQMKILQQIDHSKVDEVLAAWTRRCESAEKVVRQLRGVLEIQHTKIEELQQIEKEREDVMSPQTSPSVRHKIEQSVRDEKDRLKDEVDALKKDLASTRFRFQSKCKQHEHAELRCSRMVKLLRGDGYFDRPSKQTQTDGDANAHADASTTPMAELSQGSNMAFRDDNRSTNNNMNIFKKISKQRTSVIDEDKPSTAPGASRKSLTDGNSNFWDGVVTAGRSVAASPKPSPKKSFSRLLTASNGLSIHTR